MRVLVACECSQRVVAAFRSVGHEAYSCDIEPSYGGHPEWHIEGDVLPLLPGNVGFITEDGSYHCIYGHWDLIIAFPPCTYLTKAGNRHFSPKHYDLAEIEARKRKRDLAARFFMEFINAPCERIVVENPVGYMNTFYRRPDQIIQPYWFGDDAEKATCLWLKGVPKLLPTDILPRPKPHHYRADGKAVRFVESVPGTGGQKNRARVRSQTFQGIAAAMAVQWG